MTRKTDFTPPNGAFWVFGYGALMWHADFPFTARRHAILYGYHRALCVYSWVYRGTEENPGLVFGLDRGGAVNGMAYRIAGKNAKDVFEKIYAQEMVTAVYRPRWLDLRLTDGTPQTVKGLVFVANEKNEQYAGKLSEDDLVRLTRAGHGSKGPCSDYVLNTADHLRECGIRDRRLERLARRLTS
ncbi:MAG: gamma-glutamylcyclotransferase [Rhodospirillales bacterium]|nr:gamma-glutamylcyclotransferase [Rhodospirillales bacterium]MBO6785326.1 gamma-glutamylcyclotransferase [Rhodospirillales bacterium]